MPDHDDSLGGETSSGEAKQDPAEQILGDGAAMGGDTASHSLGDQSTFGDAHVDDDLFDDGMELVDLSTRYTEEGVLVGSSLIHIRIQGCCSTFQFGFRRDP